MHRAHSVLALVLTCAFAAGCDPGPTEPRDAEIPDDPACQLEERVYVSTDTAVCASILFVCEEGYEPFDDDCGCGCALDEEDPSAALEQRAIAAAP